MDLIPQSLEPNCLQKHWRNRERYARIMSWGWNTDISNTGLKKPFQTCISQIKYSFNNLFFFLSIPNSCNNKSFNWGSSSDWLQIRYRYNLWEIPYLRKHILGACLKWRKCWGCGEQAGSLCSTLPPFITSLMILSTCQATLPMPNQTIISLDLTTAGMVLPAADWNSLQE